MANTAKVHRSMRIDADTDAAILSLKASDENVTDAYNRFLRAGVEAIRGETPQAEPEPARDILIETLERYVGTLEEQIHAKDAQITELHSSLMAAQTLHQQFMQRKAIEGGPPEYEETPQEYTQDVHQAQAAHVEEPASTQAEYAPRTRGGLFSRIFGIR